MNAIAKGISDGGIVTWRNLLNIRRNPEWLMAATLQPVMFVLLFAYVFGDAIGGDAGGGAYREFLIAGIFAQTVAFNSAFTVIGFANDLQKGIIDRFRSLPMSRLAVVLGRTTSDLVVSIVALVVMFVPTDKLPGVLKAIADWNPFTAVINATRDLFGNRFGTAPAGWPADHAALYSIVCCLVIIAIFAPLATARYRRVASK